MQPAWTGWLDPNAFPALPRRPLRFPRDHAGHPQAPVEHWQVRGILSTAAGEKHAFQLHLLAISLTPEPPRRPSAWAAQRYFFGYFTRTSEKPQDFHVVRRSERAVLELAGAREGRIWIDDWSLSFRNDAIMLHAGPANGWLELKLTPRSSPRVSPASGSLHHYRLSHLRAQGNWGDKTVSGFAWLEHGWGVLPLAGTAAALQRVDLLLEDGQELSCWGIQIQQRPSRLRCHLEDRVLSAVSTKILRYWRDEGGRRYPVAWQLHHTTLDLTLRAVVPQQSIPTPLPLWSGWVTASGTWKGEGFVQILGSPQE